jgi:GT2 family glycosyltransferase
MNPVLILTRNNLALTKRCVESVRKQDIPTETLIYDNGSTDGTVDWLSTGENGGYTLLSSNRGVSAAWNMGLDYLVQTWGHALVIGNDTVMAPCTYRILLETSRKYRFPFVTGVAVDNMEQALQTPDVDPITYHPDFSCFLITRQCWEKVGPFDEGMKHYSSDQDFHIRAHRRGVRLCKASVPYYHERSSTIRLASPEERAEIEAQANKDRAYLRQKWGVSAGGADYEALFDPKTFGCEQIQPSQTAPVRAESGTDT